MHHIKLGIIREVPDNLLGSFLKSLHQCPRAGGSLFKRIYHLYYGLGSVLQLRVLAKLRLQALDFIYRAKKTFYSSWVNNTARVRSKRGSYLYDSFQFPLFYPGESDFVLWDSQHPFSGAMPDECFHAEACTVGFWHPNTCQSAPSNGDLYPPEAY